MQGVFSLLFLFLDQKQLLRIILVPSFLFQNNRASWHLKILVMYQIEQTQIFHARWPLTSDLRILFSQEFESCRTSRFWVNTNQADAASHITTDGTPLKFVSTGGNLTSAGRLTFCRLARNVICYIQKADAVSKILAGWLQALFLTAFSPHFLFRSWFSFGVAESLTPWTRKEKTHQKIQLQMLNNHNQSLISSEWCYPLDKLSLSTGYRNWFLYT